LAKSALTSSWIFGFTSPSRLLECISASLTSVAEILGVVQSNLFIISTFLQSWKKKSTSSSHHQTNIVLSISSSFDSNQAKAIIKSSSATSHSLSEE